MVLFTQNTVCNWIYKHYSRHMFWMTVFLIYSKIKADALLGKIHNLRLIQGLQYKAS
mgnify:CR=1 FL=1